MSSVLGQASTRFNGAASTRFCGLRCFDPHHVLGVAVSDCGSLVVGEFGLLEGDNQKQADFLARALTDVDASVVHDLHMLISSVSIPEHLDVFQRGIASKLDLAYAGPQSLRIAQFIEDGVVHIGSVHTYVELYARMFVDLTPHVAMLVAEQADRAGNLYTRADTEDTPTIAEAAAFGEAVVIVQVDKIVDTLPRVDIPADWVDLVVEAPRPHMLEPLFTRDPRQITDVQVLQAMLALRGVYESSFHIGIVPAATGVW